MDSISDMLSWAQTGALAIVLAACAGLRAWLPLFAAGLLGRLGIAHLEHGFAWLQSVPALALFGIATVIEMLADKIPVLDHALDAISTLLRPLAGACVAAAVAYKIDNPLLAGVFGLIVGAPTAAVPHAVKSAARGLSSATTLGIANPLLSFVEDAIAIALAMLAFLVPIASLVLLVLAIWLVLQRIRARRPRAPQPMER